MFFRLLAATPVATVLLTACAATGPAIESPTVRLDAVEVTSLSLAKQKFVLTFDVANPNPFPLPVRTIRYEVLLEKERFAGGETTSEFTIPASGDGRFSINVEVDLMRQATSLVSIIGSGVARPIDYELHGSLHVALPFARPLTFASSGTITVQGERL